MLSSGQKILVTGAAGFIGRRLVEKLIAAGAKVTAVDLPGVQFPAWQSAECVHSHLDDAAELKKLCADKDVIFHLAFPVSDWENEARFQQALEHSEAICQLAAATGARLIVTTSVVVYADRIGKGPITEETPHGKAIGHYTAYKQQQERIALQYAHEHKADIRIVRPANVYGPGSKPWVVEVARVLAKGMPALIDGGKGRAGLVLVDNLVEVLLLTSKADLPRGEIFLAVDENTVTWQDYFNAIAGFIKADAPKSMPRFLAEIVASGGELLWKTLGLAGRPPITRQALMLVGADNDFRNDKIKRVLGFKPVKTHEQGLWEIAAFLAKNTWQEK